MLSSALCFVETEELTCSPFVGRQVEDGHAIVQVPPHGVAVKRVLWRAAYRRVVHVRSHQHAEPLPGAPVEAILEIVRKVVYKEYNNYICCIRSFKFAKYLPASPPPHLFSKVGTTVFHLWNS